jgi:hypothetical protein
MNYVVIATILSTVSSAKLALGKECSKIDDCVDDASCSDVFSGDGSYKSMCILTSGCNDTATELDGADTKKYKAE